VERREVVNMTKNVLVAPPLTPLALIDIVVYLFFFPLLEKATMKAFVVLCFFFFFKDYVCKSLSNTPLEASGEKRKPPRTKKTGPFVVHGNGLIGACVLVVSAVGGRGVQGQGIERDKQTRKRT